MALVLDRKNYELVLALGLLYAGILGPGGLF